MRRVVTSTYENREETNKEKIYRGIFTFNFIYTFVTYILLLCINLL